MPKFPRKRNTTVEIFEHYTIHLLKEILPKRKTDFRKVGLPIYVIADYLNKQYYDYFGTRVNASSYAFLTSSSGRDLLRRFGWYVGHDLGGTFMRRMCAAQKAGTYRACSKCEMRLHCLSRPERPPLL